MTVGPGIAVAAPFGWRCPMSPTVAPFPHPPHRTGRALLTHPALFRHIKPSRSSGRVQPASGVSASTFRRGTGRVLAIPRSPFAAAPSQPDPAGVVRTPILQGAQLLSQSLQPCTWLLRSWLSPVTCSAGFEPNRAGLIGSRQSPGSSRFAPSHRNRGPSLHQRYPASSLLHPHPPSAAADSTPREVVVARLPAGHHHGLPLLHDRSVVMRAATITPVDAVRAHHAHLRTAGGLPRC